ncbi:MAG: glycerophosphodiester phosphodiesterase [Candidatus Nanopelagicales bacterium]|nr:glycerophosphodiester phosphodiesterase [Candidatus Nanopelagicales bacterium]
MPPVNSRHPFVDSEHPIALAHRGGARENSENSLTAFRRAADIGYRYFETDVRATADGVVMVFHDSSLNRVTDRVGRISALPYDEVRKALIAGRDPVMRLEELLAAFPESFFNIDVKDDHTLGPFIDLIERLNVLDRICVASFSASRLRTIRKRWPEAATSLAPPEALSLWASSQAGPLSPLAGRGIPRNAVAVQVPAFFRGITLVTPAFLKSAHDRGLAVHVWTVDHDEKMHRLLDLGVDGIITDRPTTLRRVLVDRGQWPSD